MKDKQFRKGNIGKYFEDNLGFESFRHVPQFGTDFKMVVLSSPESSSLTFPPISDVVFVMEETASTALYLMPEMRDNYIVPTLEHFGE